MAETLQVVITGKDGVSRVFKEISQSADATGKSVEQAGEKGEKGFRRLGDSAGKAKVSVSDLGAAATALGGFLAYAGDSALKQQQTIIGLESAFGDAADEYIAFADTIASNSIFNDDDVLKGERYFATLKNNYGLLDSQIQELMRTTADLASAYGMTFEDASSRVTAAIRGEGEAAEALGLTMNQQSIDRNNLTLTMSNQEAAQFRLNALYEQSGVYQGTAQRLAESEVGTRARLTNAIQDNAQALGSFIGPMGSMIAGTGFAVTGIGQMTGSLGKLATVARGSSTAMSAMSLAMGPVGIGIGALVAGGALLINSWQDQKHAAEEYAAALRDLDMTQEMLRRRGDEGLANQSQRAEELAGTLKANIDQFSDFETYLAGVEERLGHTIYVGSTEYDMYLTAWSSAMDQIGTSAEDTSAVLAKFNEALSDPSINVDAYLTWAIGLMDAAGKTETAIDDAAAVQTILNTELSQFSIASGVAASSAQVYTDTLGMLSAGLNAVAASQEHVNAVALQSMETVVGAINQGNRALERSQELQARSAEIAADSMAASWEHAAELQQIYVDNLTQLQDVAGFGDPLSSWNLAGHASELSLLADAASDAATSLETVFRVTVGNTNAIGQQTESIAKWADTLIGAPGVWAEIDDLMSRGLLTLNEYNAAQAAQVSIAQDNASIQDYIREIQIDQAPLIAAQTAALEDQMELIAAMPTDQQLVTLGWMDSATAAQALELRTMGVAAAAGELGKNGEQAFATMVTGAANADPALKAVLENMGLISEGANGEIVVHVPEDTMSDMDRLTTAIVSLSDLLDDGELNGSVNMQVLGIEEVEKARQDIVALPAQKDVAVSVTLTEGGPDVGGFFSGILERNGIGGGSGLSIPADLELSDGAISGLQGALDANPLTATVDFAALGGSAAGSAMDAARSALGAAQNHIELELDIVDNASPVLKEVQTLAGSIESYTATLTVNAQDNASLTIGDVVSFMASVEGYSSTMQLLADDLASPAIGEAVSFMASVEGYSSTMAIDAVDNASPVIGDAVRLLASIDGYMATTYLNIVTNRVDGSRHGGIPGYAHGGVVAELGESGPEMLHFAGGGMAPVYQRGIYEVPANTYVSPANANPNVRSGATVTFESITINGSNPEEIKRVFVDEIQPAIIRALDTRERGFGGPW